MKRLPKLIVAVDGTLMPGVRRILRAGKGDPGWHEAVTRVMPLFDRSTRHFRESAVPADESDIRILDATGLRELVGTYIETVNLAQDLQKFVGEYVASGGEVVLVLPPLIARDASLGLRLREKLSGFSSSVPQIMGLDIEEIDDDSVVVLARTDEVRLVMKKGKHAIAYIDPSRLTREIRMRTNVAEPTYEGRRSLPKEDQS